MFVSYGCNIITSCYLCVLSLSFVAISVVIEVNIQKKNKIKMFCLIIYFIGLHWHASWSFLSSICLNNIKTYDEKGHY